MKAMRTRLCGDDADFAAIARFYIANSKEFRPNDTLYEAIIHILDTIHSHSLFLVEDESGELIAYNQFRYESESAAIFIESTMLAREYRSSRMFLRCFRELVSMFGKQYPQAGEMRFHALADHAYLNRLYAKFAVKAGTIEREGFMENVYAVPYPDLRRYLGLSG